jgi:hypothetical protein
MKRLATLFVAGIVGAGCDMFYGILHKTQTFSPIPSDSCVVSAVQSIPGMSNVSSHLEAGGQPLTLHGIEKPDEIHRFSYEYYGVRSGFLYSVRYNGRAEFSHNYIYINRKPPQETIDRLYPALRAVDSALESQCGLVGLVASIREQCLGVRCGGF